MPWGGIDDFYVTNAAKQSFSDSKMNHDDTSSSDSESDEPMVKPPEDWAATFMCVKIKFGSVTLHNDDPVRPLPVGRFYNQYSHKFDNLYARMLENMSPWQRVL